MRIVTFEYEVYSYNELPECSKEKAVNEVLSFIKNAEKYDGHLFSEDFEFFKDGSLLIE